MQTQCQKPRGWLGRLSLWRMNLSHSKLTAGACSTSPSRRTSPSSTWAVAAAAPSANWPRSPHRERFSASISPTPACRQQKTNARWIADGRVEIREASVSQLPFGDATLISSPPSKRTSGGLTCPATRAKSFASPSPAARWILDRGKSTGARTPRCQRFRRARGARSGLLRTLTPRRSSPPL